jgi:hypothetical protein
MTLMTDCHSAPPAHPTAIAERSAEVAVPTGLPTFVEPRLCFVEPVLTPRGDLRQVTAGFFGPFSP